MKKCMIVANWKMNTTYSSAENLVSNMKQALIQMKGLQVVLCPPFVSLAPIRDMLDGSGIAVGAQNMYHELEGAFTGEVSPMMLAELCTFVILGHSERRYILGESDEDINKKIKSAIEADLAPILCVGEKLEEKQHGSADYVVEQQILKGLDGVVSIQNLVVAYEPVWAIGTGHAATPDDAQLMNVHIRKTLANKYGNEIASGVSLLYGGSVKADNVAEFLEMPDVNGALVGGASLNSSEFIRLVRNSALR